ncbi:MAG: hypothetical protein DWQ02_05735 [Bacteroidetes bacterium]|nr:MAG: hypothetical protein DWQ02_05735 [Bacteroidota bacterium]
MDEYLQESKNLALEFSGVKPSGFFTKVLLVFIIISFLVAIFVLSSIAIIGIEAGPILGAILFIIIGIYFLRLYLWNTRGLEKLNINEQTIVHTLDYGLFKDVDEIKNTNLIVQYGSLKGQVKADLNLDAGILDNPNEFQEKSFFIIIIDEDNTKIQVNAKLNFSQMNQIVKRLNMRKVEH